MFLGDSKEVNSTGRYDLQFCKAGRWTTLVVDDFVPCAPEGGPIYARSHGNELWVILLEKVSTLFVFFMRKYGMIISEFMCE